MKEDQDKELERTLAKKTNSKEGNQVLKKVFSDIRDTIAHLRFLIVYLLFDKEASHRESEVTEKDLREKRGELAILKNVLRTVRKSLDSVRKSLRKARNRNADLVMENWRLRNK